MEKTAGKVCNVACQLLPSQIQLSVPPSAPGVITTLRFTVCADSSSVFAAAGFLAAIFLALDFRKSAVAVNSWQIISCRSSPIRRVRDEAARTYIRTFGAISDDELLGLLHELAEAAAATVEAQGVPRSEQATTYHVDLRYHGQGFEITVPAEVAAFDGHGGGLAALAAAFDAEHTRLFSFLLQGNEHELVSARVWSA